MTPNEAAPVPRLVRICLSAFQLFLLCLRNAVLQHRKDRKSVFLAESSMEKVMKAAPREIVSTGHKRWRCRKLQRRLIVREHVQKHDQ